MLSATPVVEQGGFVLTEKDFRWLRSLAEQHSGIMLPDAKRTMLYSRLSKRLRALGLPDFAAYRKRLENRDSGEFREFINALTTNLTSFFREPHHFDHLAVAAMPARMAERRARHDNRFRIWSAAASTGEEPYSIAMTVLENMPGGAHWDFRVLATDLDTQVLAKARAGIYRDETLERIDDTRRRRWFFRGVGKFAGLVRVKPALQEPVEFRPFNLVKPWTLPEPFDAIFCRNVVIYFDKFTQRDLFARMADVLVPGGYLYLGHSETLFEISDRFELVGKTTYRKL